MDSISLRHRLRHWRANLSSHEQQQAAEQAAQQFINSDLFFHSQHIACYLPFMGELDTSPVINTIFQRNKRCYLPVMDVARPGHMRFLEYRQGDALVKNYIGILEPRANARVMQPWALDVVITPLVAFDLHGNRLGSGCGFYDRMFAGMHDWAKRPVLCGYAYQAQAVERFDVQPWDVPMDVIITG